MFFKQINAALVSIRKFFQKYKKSHQPKMFEKHVTN